MMASSAEQQQASPPVDDDLLHDHEIDDEDEDESEKESVLSKVFASCAGDPKGSVHRAWGVSLIFLVVYFVLSIFESKFDVDTCSMISIF